MIDNKPETIGVRLDAIPPMLKTLDRWLLWGYQKKKTNEGVSKWAKVPMKKSGGFASVNDARTWCSFEEAAEAVKSDKFSGIGLVIPEGIVGIDFDDCYTSNGFDEQARMLLAMLPTYAEISPSGSGVKLLAAGALDKELRTISHGKGIELYDGANTNRFFCITGNVLQDEHHKMVTNQRDSLSAIQAMISEPKKKRKEDASDPAKVDRALDYLAHLSAERCEDYAEWLSVGMALHWCEDSDDMLSKWCEWSAQSPKFIEEDARATWGSFKRSKSERVITLAWLERAAKEDGYDPERYTTGAITAAELLDKEIVRDYIVEDFVVAGEPMIIGGAAKALKTTLSLELAIAISTGKPFLDTFDVPKARPVMVISGESGEGTIQECIYTMSEAKGIPRKDLDNLYIGFRLPKLDVEDIVIHLLEELAEKGISIVIIDPLYRSLRVGDSASNVYAMGAQLDLIAEKLNRAGITVILCHHFKKQGKSYDAPNLEDLSQSGVAEFGRQFMLIKRREEYKMDGRHTLWILWGGSAGHQGMKMLEAYTGTKATGLTWEHNLQDPAAWQALRDAAKKQEAEDRKAEKAAEKAVQDAQKAEEKEALEAELKIAREAEDALLKDRILEYVRANPRCTTRDIRTHVKAKTSRTTAIMGVLEAEGVIRFEAGSKRTKNWEIAKTYEDYGGLI